MFSGTLIVHNIPNREKDKSVEYIELVDSSIDNFKLNIEKIFKSNEWNITTALFQKSGTSKLCTIDEMSNTEFVFTTVKVFWLANI